MATQKTSSRERERREALARKRRKKRRSAAFFLLFVFTIAGLAVCMSLFFGIETIEVDIATASYTEQQIIEASGIREGGNMFLFSARRAKNKIETALINLDEVTVTRVFPNTVVIQGVELSQYAVIVYDGGRLAISQNLRIFSGDALPADGAMLIYGITPASINRGELLEAAEGQQLNYEALETLFEVLAKYELFGEITEINVSDRLNITLVYQGRVDVALGTINNADYKIKMLKNLVENEIGEEESGGLDLSVAGRATFKPY